MTDTGMNTVTGTAMGTGSCTLIEEFLINSLLDENLINDYGCGCGYGYGYRYGYWYGYGYGFWHMN